jgi:glycosyltransferase involved in cell wall biosynthesis
VLNPKRRQFMRVIPELRNNQPEQSSRFTDSRIVFRTAKPDLELAALPGRPQQLGIRGAATLAMGKEWDIVELPEPLYLRALPLTIAVGLATRVGDTLHSRHTRIVAYAIENNDVEILFKGLPRLAQRLLLLVLRGIFAFIFDRVAFGSHGAESTYTAAKILGSRCAVTMKSERPTECKLESEVVKEDLATFVGALEPRKGLDRLLSAWLLTDAAKTGWRLAIAGEGPMQSDVESISSREPSINYLGKISRAELHDCLSRSRLVIQPSVKEGRWREQIGLPIAEGLAHGCHIITSEDTGLAPWLTANGHSVVPSPFSVPQLAAAMTQSMQHPLDPVRILSTLPERHGRQEAEDWMYENAQLIDPTAPDYQ